MCSLQNEVAVMIINACMARHTDFSICDICSSNSQLFSLDDTS